MFGRSPSSAGLVRAGMDRCGSGALCGGLGCVCWDDEDRLRANAGVTAKRSNVGCTEVVEVDGSEVGVGYGCVLFMSLA